MKQCAPPRAVLHTCRVVIVGDTCTSEERMAAIVGRDKRYRTCGGAHSFFGAVELIRERQPDVLLVEPFLEGCDSIRWIADLATGFAEKLPRSGLDIP